MKKILIIEDNFSLARSIKEFLGAKKYSIIIDTDGKRGLDRAKSTKFDLIILDVLLPSKTGFEIVGVLRRHQREVPILMISTQDKTDNIINGLEIGADGYLPKPFNLRELKARVNALLTRPPKTRRNVIIMKNLKFDMESMTVTKDNKLISFRPKELEVLKYLLENPEKIITKDQILNNVWSLNADPSPGIVDVYLSRIRNKLGTSKSNQIIQTVHGIGFKISLE